MNSQVSCSHCSTVNVIPDADFFDDLCGVCGQDVFGVPEKEEIGVGSVCEGANGLSIVTPLGKWELQDKEVLPLLTVLSAAFHSRLTRPVSPEDGSTILSRGCANAGRLRYGPDVW
ncbi:MAG: hypothetical protein Q4F10_02795 [Corynebacterium glutamicum]|nr:hypothetical protein [Corynebacterium glutamicum]